MAMAELLKGMGADGVHRSRLPKHVHAIGRTTARAIAPDVIEHALGAYHRRTRPKPLIVAAMLLDKRRPADGRMGAVLP